MLKRALGVGVVACFVPLISDPGRDGRAALLYLALFVSINFFYI
jgi:hypothetical protein